MSLCFYYQVITTCWSWCCVCYILFYWLLSPTGKNNGFPFLDILGYLKNTHKNPKFGKVRQVPTKFPDLLFQIWDFCGYSLNTLKYPKMGIGYFCLWPSLFSEFISSFSPPDCTGNAFFSFLSSSLQREKIQYLNMNSKWSAQDVGIFP